MHYKKTFLASVLIIFFLRLLIAALMPLSADEAYYFLYVINLSPGYFDHPPLVALAGAIFSLPLNNFSPFFLRLGPVILFTLAIGVFKKLSNLFFNQKEAFFSSIIFLYVPMFFLSGTLLLPDAPFILFWITSLFYFKKSMETSSLKNWILLGISGGLALLSKYTALFLFGGALVYMLSSRDKRKLFLTPGPYLSVLTALIIFLPVILWNLQNDFAGFNFYLTRSYFSGLNLNYLAQFLGGQVAYLLPFFFFPAIYFSLKSLRGFFGNSYEKFIFCFGFIPLAFFILYSLFSRALYHWALPAYITLSLPVGKFYYGLYLNKRKKFKKYTFMHTGLVLFFIAAALLQMHRGTFYNRSAGSEAASEPQRIRPSDISMSWMGWEKAVVAVDNITEGDDIFLFTDKWYTAGYLAHAAYKNYTVLVLSRLKNARGFNFWQDQNKYIGKDGFFITTSRVYSDRQAKYSPYFKTIKFKKSIPVKRKGVTVKYIYVYRCFNLLRPYG